MSVLNKNLVLVLNSVWQVIGYTSVKKAITSMYSTKDGENSATQALDLEYNLDEKGFINFESPSKFDLISIPEWNDLPVRDFDIPIATAHKIVRAPVVIMTRNYSKMNFKKLTLNRRNVYNLYGGKDIWTGKVIDYKDSTLEHVICKTHKGDSSWTNIGISHKDLNQERGNTPLDKWKYKPQYQLKEPKKIPVSAFIKEAVRPEWIYFLMK